MQNYQWWSSKAALFSRWLICHSLRYCLPPKFCLLPSTFYLLSSTFYILHSSYQLMPFDPHYLSAIGLGIALSACCGFRVFIPLLAASGAGMLGWYQLAPDMQWLAEWPALICFGTAALLEIAAYYIPFVDNLLDTISTPLAVVAGTLLASSILPIHENESLLRWAIALLAGGGTAGTIQVGTSILRLFSSKATVGTGNVAVATGENAAAVGGTIFSFILPVIMAACLLLLVLYILYKLLRRLLR